MDSVPKLEKIPTEEPFATRHKYGDPLVEALAHTEHDSWARWMEYLFACSTSVDQVHGSALRDPDALVIPGEKVRRWRRQAETAYQFLNETEKESDRKEVDNFLRVLDRFLTLD